MLIQISMKKEILMANDILISLLKEYEQKKLNAEHDLEIRKQHLYDLIPRLKEIDKGLNDSAITAAKNILNSDDKKQDSELLNSLNDNLLKLKKEKEEILKSNNFDLSYLQPSYECKICNDTGYITDSNFNTVMCSCLKQKLLDASFNKSNMYNIKTENFNSFNEKLYSDVVNIERYKFKESPRQNILNIKNRCEDFIRNFDDINNKNLLFTGSTGLR